MRKKLALLVAYATAFSTVVLVASPAQSLTQVDGTVTDAGTRDPIENICVEVHDATAEGTVAAFALTDSLGAYDISGLADIDYRLFFYEPATLGDCGTTVEIGSPRWTAEWNDGATTHATAPNAGGLEDVELLGTGMVSGTVYDDDGATPLTCRVDVRLFNTANGESWLTDDTTGTGNYSITGLVPGYTYALHFDPINALVCNGLAAEWHGNVHAIGDGDGGSLATFIAEAAVAGPVTSTVGGAQVIDATLENGATITGHMIGEITGADVVGVNVRLHAGGDPTGGDHILTTTDGTGTFTFTGLANDPNGYNLLFEDAGDWEGEWYDDSVTGQGGRAVIAVTPGATTDLLDIDRHGPGHLFGTVTDDETMAAIDGATVELWSSDGLTLIDSDTTDAGGLYDIFDIPPDLAYDIVISASTFNPHTEDDLTVTMTGEGATGSTLLDVALVPADGTISGTVTDAGTTDPIVGATVTLYDDGGTTVIDTAVSAAGGVYTLDEVFPGTYDLRFSSGGYVTEWFDDQISAATGTVTVGYGEAVTADGALLAAAGSISGTVTDDDGGAPIQGVLVTLWDNGGATALDEAETDADGSYVFDVGVGTYDVEFDHAAYISEWYDDATAASGAVVVGIGDDVIADAGLASNAGTVSGTISDASIGLQSSHGVAGVTVEVIDESNTVVGSAVSDADGAYAVTVPPGTYRVLANTGPAEAPIGFFQAWYIEAPLFLADEATGVVVGQAATVTAIDIALQPLFTDVSPASTFYQNILWLQQSGITAGCTLTEFCPGDSVTRAQMATFLARALDLPATTTDYFTDDGGSVHEDNINALREAGITLGCDATGTVFCPNASVTRGQMAAFLNRALAE